MSMYVYASKVRNKYSHALTAIAVETNLQFAVPYWSKRREVNPNIFWVIK